MNCGMNSTLKFSLPRIIGSDFNDNLIFFTINFKLQSIKVAFIKNITGNIQNI